MPTKAFQASRCNEKISIQKLIQDKRHPRILFITQAWKKRKERKEKKRKEKLTKQN